MRQYKKKWAEKLKAQNLEYERRPDVKARRLEYRRERARRKKTSA
jgi:hypothetical protein